MKIYGIYDLEDKEQCVLVGTLSEIAERFKLSARAIDTSLKKRKYSK